MTETICIMAIADQSNREKEIFEQALDITPTEERLRFLTSACGQDAALLARVQALLRADESGESFLPEQPKAIVVPITEKPGDRIGRYKLLQQIGEGGCGVVYMAEQTEPVRRRVALKVIKLGMDTKQVIARFEAERQALALMDHPNIAKVLDAGATETGRPYFVMELVRGIKITEFCDEKSVPTADRLKLFTQVCQAIQHAHQKGVIHRDIKPSNILVTVNDGVPVPKIIDFGIAKATAGPLTDKTFFTAFEQFIGTPAYMSPEQAEMTSLDIDTRTDIYSLGVLLYELLTGRTPFDPSELLQSGLDEMRRTIREKEPDRPSTRLSTMAEGELTTVAKHRHTEAPRLIHLVRGDLDWIVMKCLEKDRARRYETANGLASDIQRHLNDEPVVARPPSALYRIEKLVRRKRLAFTAAALVALALVLGIVASTWQAIRATHFRRQAQDQAGRAEAEALTNRQNLYAAHMNLANLALETHNLGRFRELLEKHVPKSEARTSNAADDLRGWEWRYLYGQCHSDDIGILARNKKQVSSVCFSPDGRLVAAWNAHEIRLWNSATGEEVRKLKDFKGSLSAVAFSPDGRTLAAATTRFSFKKHEPIFKSEIRLCDLATGAVTQTLSLSTQSISGLVFALNGRQLLIGGLQREATHSFATLELADIQTGSLGSLLANDEGTVSSVVLSPDGGALAFQSDASTVNLVDTQTWKIKQTFDENSDSTAGPRSFSRFLLSVRRVLALAFSPDGNTVSAEIEQDGIKSWDPRTGEVKNQIAAHEDTPAMVEIAANGKTVAEVGSNESVRLWDVGSGAETLVPAPGGPTSALALSADGQIMAIGHAGRIALLDTATHKLIRTLEGPQTKVNDGRTLATAAEDGLIQTWDLAGAQIIRTIMAAGKVTALRFAPGSRTLVSAGEDGMVNLWDLQTGGLSLQLKKHTATVNAIAFSPDGALMATGGDDRTVIIWETASGKTRRRLKGHDLTVTYLAFSPDATLVASGSGNASVVLWDVQTGKLNRVLR